MRFVVIHPAPILSEQSKAEQGFGLDRIGRSLVAFGGFAGRNLSKDCGAVMPIFPAAIAQDFRRAETVC
jgi:hypothetical protein